MEPSRPTMEMLRDQSREEAEMYVLFVVQGLHGGISLSIVRISNEAKASAAAGITIFHHHLRRCKRVLLVMTSAGLSSATHGFFDGAKLLELLAQSRVVGMPREPSANGQRAVRMRGREDLPNKKFRHGD